VREKKLGRNRNSSIIIWTFVFLAVLVSVYINFAVAKKAKHGDVSHSPILSSHAVHSYYQFCLILDDNFKTFNKDVWSSEVQVSAHTSHLVPCIYLM